MSKQYTLTAPYGRLALTYGQPAYTFVRAERFTPPVEVVLCGSNAICPTPTRTSVLDGQTLYSVRRSVAAPARDTFRLTARFARGSRPTVSSQTNFTASQTRPRRCSFSTVRRLPLVRSSLTVGSGSRGIDGQFSTEPPCVLPRHLAEASAF